MHRETETKTRKQSTAVNSASIKLAILGMSFILLSACSFIELTPGAEHIIYANQESGCEKVKSFEAQVKTTTLFLERRPEAIAEELKMLAQNEAYALYANAIWPTSEIDNGKQHFDILKCN